MPSKKPHAIDISYKVFVKFFLVVAAVLILYAIADVLATVLFAVVVASAIEPVISRLKEYKVPRILGVLMIYLAVLSVLVLTLYFIVPTLIDEIKAFQKVFYIYQKEFVNNLKVFQGIPFLETFFTGAQSLLKTGGTVKDVGALATNTLSALSVIFGGIFSFVILIVASFYLAAQEGGIEKFIRLVSPLEYEEYLVDLWSRSQRKMGRWLRAQILLGMLIGATVFIILTILDIPYALLFAVLAALLEIVPVIGPIVAAIPAVLTAFLKDPVLGVVVILIYFVIQQTESHLFVPVVMRKTVGLNPLVVVIALLVGAQLGGILGLFLAVPLASVIVEFVVDIDKRKRGLFHEVRAG